MNIITNSSIKYYDPNEEYNNLIKYIYKNLATETYRYMKSCTKNKKKMPTSDNQIAFTAIERRWRENPSLEQEDVGMFLTYKQNYFNYLLDKGLSINSFSRVNKEGTRYTGRTGLANGLCRAFINHLINQYKHEHNRQNKFEDSIITLEPEHMDYVTNIWEDEMIKRIEQDKIDTARVDRLERALVAFKDTLTPKETIVWSYLRYPCRDEDKLEQLELACEDLGIKRRQFFNLATPIKAKALAFIKTFEK